MFRILYKLITFVFRAIKFIVYLFVPEETRTQLKEGARAKAATAGKAGFSFAGRIIVPLLAFCFIGFASFIYAIIPGAFDSLSNANERSPYDMSDNYNRPKVRRGIDGGNTQNSEDLRKNPIIIKDDDAELLQGTWQAQYISRTGRTIEREVIERSQLIFEGNIVIMKGDTGKDSRLPLNYKLDPSKSPKQIELKEPSIQRTIFGIYELNGNVLKICMSLRLPNNFEYEPDVDKIIMVLTKVN